MHIDKQTFEKDEIMEMMKRYKVKTSKEALEIWVEWNYPSCSGWHIRKIGKDFVEVVEE